MGAIRFLNQDIDSITWGEKMRYAKKRNRSKYYRQLLSILLAISLLFGSAIFCIYLFMTNQLNANNLEYSNQVLAEQVKRNLDNSFNIVYRLVLKLKSDTDIIEYNSIRGRDSLLEIKIRDLLNTYAGLFYDYDYDVAVMALDSETVIDGKNIMRVDDYFTNKHIDINSFQDYLQRTEQDSAFTMLGSTAQQQESLFFVTPLFSSITNNVFILVEYKVANMLRDFQGNANTQIAIMDNQGNLLASISENREPQKGRQIIIPGDNYFGFQYEYYYHVPGRGGLIAGTLILLILVAGAAMAISLLASKVLYRPISSTVTRFKKYNNGTIDDEFMFFDDTVHKFVDANRELLQTVNDHKRTMRASYLKELLNNSRHMEDIDKNLTKYHITVLDSAYAVCLIRFDNFNELSQLYDNSDLNDIRQSIQQILEDEFTNWDDFELIDYSYHTMVLIAPVHQRLDLKNCLLQLLLFVEVQYEIDLVATIGTVCHETNEVSRSYEDALVVMEYRFALDNQKVIAYEDVKDYTDTNLYYPLEMEQNLIEYTLAGNREKVSGILCALIERNFSGKALNHELQSQFKFAIVMTIKRILYKINLRQEDVFGEDCILYLEFNLREEKQDLQTASMRLFDQMIASIVQEGSRKSKKTINYILEYVQQNFTRDISLTDISEAFNLSIAHISRLFKSELHLNFKDVIAQYRIEEACRLLASGMKVQDVSAACGFNNPSVFARFFKRQEGITPAEYQRNILAEKQRSKRQQKNS